MPLICCNRGRHANECVSCIFIYQYSFGKEHQMQQETTQYRTARQDRGGNRDLMRNTIRGLSKHYNNRFSLFSKVRKDATRAQNGLAWTQSCNAGDDSASRAGLGVRAYRSAMRTARTASQAYARTHTHGKPGLCAHAYARQARPSRARIRE